MAKIYTLTDPTTNEIRYIGCTTQPLWKRLSAHISESTSNLRISNTHKSNWIRNLLSNGNKPIISLLEETSEDKLKEREKFWILYFKNTHLVNLVNGTPGGDGLPLGFKHSEDTKKRMSASKIGTRPPWMNFNNADEIRYKIGLTQQGKKLTEDHKIKISKSMIGKTKGRKYPKHHYSKKYKSVNQYSLTGKLIKTWESIKIIEETLGFKKSRISRCCNKKPGAYTAYNFKWSFVNQ